MAAEGKIASNEIIALHLCDLYQDFINNGIFVKNYDKNGVCETQTYLFYNDEKKVIEMLRLNNAELENTDNVKFLFTKIMKKIIKKMYFTLPAKEYKYNFTFKPSLIMAAVIYLNNYDTRKHFNTLPVFSLEEARARSSVKVATAFALATAHKSKQDKKKTKSALVKKTAPMGKKTAPMGKKKESLSGEYSAMRQILEQTKSKSKSKSTTTVPAFRRRTSLLSTGSSTGSDADSDNEPAQKRKKPLSRVMEEREKASIRSRSLVSNKKSKKHDKHGTKHWTRKANSKSPLHFTKRAIGSIHKNKNKGTRKR